MQQTLRKLVLFTTFLLPGGVVYAFSVPANDSVVNAVNLGPLPMPGACPGDPKGDTISLAGTTNNATFNPLDYSSLSCYPSTPSPDVWYRFRATGTYAYIEITGSGGLNNFYVKAWQSQGSALSLVPLICQVSSGGFLALTIPTPAFFGEYYLQIGGATASEAGDFYLKMKAMNECSGCVKRATLQMMPAPAFGRYNQGDTVIMCTTVDRWETVTSSFLHGIVPQFGPEWDLSSLTPLSAPQAQSSAGGQWHWSTGVSSPAGTVDGFFFDANNNNDPADNAGDDGPVLASWTGCWKIRTGTQCNSDDLFMRVNLFSDDQTGSGNGFAVCGPFDGIEVTTALSCCPALIVSTNYFNGCNGAALVHVSPDPSVSTHSFNYYLLDSNMNVIASQANMTGGTAFSVPGSGDYIIKAFDLVTSCESFQTVTLIPAIETSMVQTTTGCGSGTGSAIVNVSGTALAPFTYAWPTVVTSNYVDSVAYNLQDGWVTVIVSDAAGCNVSDSIYITSQSTPDAAFEYLDTAFCASIDTVHVTYPAQSQGGTYSLVAPLSSGISVNSANGDVLLSGATLSPPYWVYVKYSISSVCSAAYIDSFRVTPTPAAPSVVGNSTVQYCIGASPPVLTVTVPFTSYAFWYDLQTTQSAVGTSFTPSLSSSTSPGTYLYSVSSVLGSNLSCYSLPVFFAVMATDPPYFNISADTTICSGEMADIAVTPCSTCVYSWNPAPTIGSSSAAASITSPQSSTTYTMTATNAAGCSSSLYTSVFVTTCDSSLTNSLHVYSGITPNNDGQNDLWIIDGIDQYPASTISIYNRWGKLVWKKSNYDNVNIVWNGTDQDGNALPDGTYYYLINTAAFQVTDWVELSH